MGYVSLNIPGAVSDCPSFHLSTISQDPLSKFPPASDFPQGDGIESELRMGVCVTRFRDAACLEGAANAVA